jgi:protein-disulfide isomerase
MRETATEYHCEPIRKYRPMSKTINPLKKSSGASINLLLTVAVVVAAAGVIGGVLYINSAKAPHHPSARAVVPATVLRKADSHTLTTAVDNKVTLTEFVDYQCPVCHKYYEAITNKIEHDYRGRITYVVRNYPLPMHPLAQVAAQAVEAAGLQGKYDPMYHAVEDNYRAWAMTPDGQNVSNDTRRALAQFHQDAQRIGLRMQRFDQDMNSPAVRNRINQDKADGDTAKVTGTPTLFLNGQEFQPSRDTTTYQQLDLQLRGQLDRELTQ